MTQLDSWEEVHSFPDVIRAGVEFVKIMTSVIRRYYLGGVRHENQCLMHRIAFFKDPAQLVLYAGQHANYFSIISHLKCETDETRSECSQLSWRSFNDATRRLQWDLIIICVEVGRYTRDVGDYEILVPRRVDCHGSFVSYSVPKYYKRNGNRKKRNTPSDDEKLHYDLHFDGKNHLIELWPNHDFLSPGLVTETWGEGAASDLNEVKIRSVGDNQCHYTGKIKGFPETRVAVSLCNGMAGHIRTKRHHYLIEPVKDHGPEDDGQHLHMIYTRTPSQKRKRTCGLNDNWQTAWSKRLGNEFRERKGANTDLRAEHTKRMRKVEEKAPISYSNSKRGTTSELNYMEILMVADKKFLQHYNGSDYEQYLFTILNMVSDLFHDASVGNEIDVNLVRVIYLEKEENELDLMINTDAPSTLENFCKWSDSMNFETSHPNHHDIAVLVTKYDICVKGKCDTAGLAYVAGACQKGLSCAYCEDLGLSLATVMTHEIGHLLGSDHDKEEENLPVGECPAMADDYRIHVMSPWSQLATANWSACSKKFITEFLENDLGKCLLDEPQDHSFKIPEMPPGVVYDAIWQCSQLYGPSKPCDMGPERNCKQLSCETPDGKSCMTNGDPPADGTSCGVNKPCEEDALTFREVQCKEHDADEIKWTPYNDGKAEHVCALVCSNNQFIFKVVEPRVKDGTACKRGSKDRCIAGECRKVGCDWVLDSNAVEDKCGVCNGDGSTCRIYDKIFNETKKDKGGYQKILTIPVGCRKISIEEVKISQNFLALGAPDEKTFYLNGN
ncbi:hypothetical protein C0J52_17987 [Blattella germanica]|nr:hypothetical protein C0J52_17987 [Blattella germanica]